MRGRAYNLESSGATALQALRAGRQSQKLGAELF